MKLKFRNLNSQVSPGCRILAARLMWVSVISLLLTWTGVASAKIRVAASITDLASIASSVGGDQVECFSIARPTADVHHVEVLPSYMVRVSRTDVYLKVGMQLDQWADQIIDGSRNDRLVIVDCSRDIDPLEKPTGKVTAAMGDVHPNGNPHYWLDPRNGAIVAAEVAEALSRVDPAHATDYQSRAQAFAKAVDSEMVMGQRIVSSLPSKVVITYHASWIYLTHAFGLEIAGEAEPFPGIPPTGRHLQELVDVIKLRKVGILLQEPYFSDDAGQFLARQTGLRIIKVSPSCETPEEGSYLGHIHQVLQLMAVPTGGTGGR
jgi:zinc/manganese transport system substrate-binding protein